MNFRYNYDNIIMYINFTEEKLMSYLEAIILGIIQGLAEFLPISSSGHLALAHTFFGMTDPDTSNLAFDIMLHLGTLVAVFIMFYKDIIALIPAFFTMCGKFFSGKRKSDQYTPTERFVFYIIVATLPLVVLAVTPLKDWVDSLTSNEDIVGIVVGCVLLFNGLILIISDRLSTGRIDENNNNWKNSLIVGLCQACAIVPGLSRSGSTITGGLFRGFKREYAVKFSFILSIPAILGANILNIGELTAVGNIDWGVYIVGALTAAVFGIAAIKLLVYISKKATFTYFGYYSFVVGAASVVYSLIR